MMPLSYATPGEESIIRKIGGSPEVKKHLENRLFTESCGIQAKRQAERGNE